jgi:hypothetical protein
VRKKEEVEMEEKMKQDAVLIPLLEMTSKFGNTSCCLSPAHCAGHCFAMAPQSTCKL